MPTLLLGILTVGLLGETVLKTDACGVFGAFRDVDPEDCPQCIH